MLGDAKANGVRRLYDVRRDSKCFRHMKLVGAGSTACFGGKKDSDGGCVPADFPFLALRPAST